ncbi:hypothetical protein [Cellulomonas sp. ATA003]|uniref:hypothetical protein n=1 Tax=Cellulomonas sp. ATA003 TaxID=3073064 RepID=UPI002873134C|nr:hypothetical protein [Cellulomonas sp. ATA003]WNB85659.1 hypothetical protein REH70_19445 [Cellulomonas sp. ATA003]
MTAPTGPAVAGSVVTEPGPGESGVGASGAGPRVRLALLGVVLLVTLLAGPLGVHPSTPEQLRADVSSGRVTSVEALGYRVPDAAGGEGWMTEEIRWRTGVLTRSAAVAAGALDGAVADGAVADSAAADVVPVLRDLAPALQVERRDAPSQAWSLYGVVVPGWLALAACLGWVGAFVALVQGPEPWRLTRWGWAWSFILVPPVGITAFAVLAGPTRALPRPRRTRRVGGLGGLGLALLLLALLPAR